MMTTTDRLVLCRGCGRTLDPTVAFCPQCGEAVAYRELGTIFAVTAFFVLVICAVAAWSVVWMGDPQFAVRSSQEGPPPEGTVALESVDPRQIADNLFNHVVEAAAGSDTVQLQAYLPLAFVAYSEAGALDADGLFHLATLQRIAQDPEGAVRSAEGILEVDSTHLLGLGTAAVASSEGGDSERAAQYYSRFLDVYDAEIDRELGEYLGHSDFIARVVTDARAAVPSR